MHANSAPLSLAEALQALVLGALRTEVEQLIEAATAPLRQKVAQLESLLDEYVDTKTALRILGYKDESTLKRLREKPGTLIIVKFEGKNSQIPRYSLASLVAYNESRVVKAIEPRNLGESPDEKPDV